MFKAPGSTEVVFESAPTEVSDGAVVIAGEETGDAVPPPRTSRHIDFVDDGKLFEGHFTLHARSLKSLIQLLVDQQAEQHVIITDLQDQVNMMRLQATKMRRAGAPGGTASPRPDSEDSSRPSRGSMREIDDIRQRVKQLESFRALWGVQTEEVEDLFSAYGDPVVTPEEYTGFLLNLQPFRLLRQDTRNSIALAGGARAPMPHTESGKSHGNRDAGDSRPEIDDSSRAESQGRVANRADSKSQSSREKRGSLSDSKPSRSDGEEARSGRDDVPDDREDSRRGQDKTLPERNEPRKRRDEPRKGRGRTASNQEGRDEPSKSRDVSRADRGESRNDSLDSRNALDEPRNARDEPRTARDGPRNAREGPRNARGGSRNARGGSRNARDESRNARDDSRGARDDSRGARDDSRGARDDSRGARDDSRGARDESRGARDGPRGSRDDSRSARDGPRGSRDESRGARDDSRGARDDSRGARDGPRGSRDDSRSARDGPRGSRDDSRNAPRGPRQARGEHTAPLEQDIDDLMERMETLERRFARGLATSQQPRGGPSSRSAAPGGPTAAVVDEEARASVEDLERQVNRRFKEIERALGRSGAGASTGSTAPGDAAAPRAERSREKRPPQQGEVVDHVAREDAAASLDHVEDLEKLMHKKLREISKAIGKISSTSGHALEQVIGVTESRRPHDVSTAVSPASTGDLVDNVARNNATRSLDAVHDLEEDWGKRWQSLEERLRIIGRATVNGGPLPSASAASIDRKAREDASMSLMRIQQLERELSMVRRLLNRHKMPEGATDNADPVTAVDYSGRGAASVLPGAAMRGTPSSEKTAGAPGQALSDDQGSGSPRDADYQVRMQALENEVEHRMGEVNRALAALSVPGCAVFDSREVDDPAAAFASSLMMSPAVLVVTSRKGDGDAVQKPAVAQGHGEEIVLRSPQQGMIGAPLVKREPPADPLSQRTFAESGDNASVLPLLGAPAAQNKVADLPGSTGRLDMSGKRSGGWPGIGTTGDKFTGIKPQPTADIPGLGKVSRAGELDLLRSQNTRLDDMNVLRVADHRGYAAEPGAVGHTTPCVVYNCAWCVARKRNNPARVPYSSR